MAYGDTVVLASGGKSQRYTPSGFQFPSLSVLNPNDGVLFISNNRPVESSAYGSWDWKVPSQSYAILPGPWLSVGMLYQDQSGSGRNGELQSYFWTQKVQIPVFYAIGRALASAGTSMDITQGAQPSNPPAGTARLWADANGDLWVTLSTGQTFKLADQNDPLGGVLTGTLPNPGMANSVVGSANVIDKSLQAVDLADGIIGLGSTLIQDGAINAAKIQPKTLTGGQIADGVITSPLIPNNAITSALILDGTITSADIAGNAATYVNSMQAYSGTSTSSTSAVAMGGFSLPVNLLGNCPVRLEFCLPLYNNTVGAGMYIVVRLDGGGWTTMAYVNQFSNATYTQMVTGRYWWQSGLTPGAHTIDLGWQVTGGTATLNGAALSTMDLVEYRR